MNSHRAVVKLLLDNGADIEAKNKVKEQVIGDLTSSNLYNSLLHACTCLFIYRQGTLRYIWQQREDKHWWSYSCLTEELKLSLETKYLKIVI